ncbi:MAG: penicillin-binding transpeptidase domain-containing protein [Bacilli bacterium]|nr:penicillin-binding transpeptidase domain-containing protein [Bacilli bacterium]
MRDKKKNVKKWNAPAYFFRVVFISFLIIFAQLTYISMFPNLYGYNMDEFAKARNTYSTKLYAKRGTIFDNEGNTLALNVASYTVIAYLSETRTGKSSTPLHVVDKQLTAKKLSPILNMSEEYILSLLNKNAYQVELGPGGRGITELVKEQIEELNLPGIDFKETFKRYYPNGDFASYVIGYARQYEETDSDGYTNTSIVGELGIESKYNKLLTGTNGKLTFQRDRYGYKIPDTKEDRIEAIDGSDVYLTIDSNIQRFVESAMQNIKGYEPTWANITLMNAKTGEILATSSLPSFDPNLRNVSNYQNPIVTYSFEPGSTMKTFSYMCAIDSGKYNGNTLVNTGSLMIGDDEVRDWNRTGWGSISLDKGFVYSSNVAATTIVQNVINKSELRDCYEKYGFGKITNIELSHEAAGNLNFTYPIEVATASFGQGITTTVLQQLQGLSIIANDGKMIKPHIVSKIIDTNNNEILYEGTIQKSDQLVKKSTVEYIKNLLDQVVNDTSDWNRSGQQFMIPGYDIIGKTGTAQIGTNNGYLQGWNDYIYSFAGMYPKNDPEIIIYAAVKQPNDGSNNSIANAFKEIVINTTKYLNIFDSFDNNSSVENIVLKSYKNKDTNKVEEELKSKNIDVIKIGNGNKIIKQYPKSGSEVLSYQKVMLVTNDTNYELPSLYGWSKQDCKNLFKLINRNYITEGNGYVTSYEMLEDGTVKLLLNNKWEIG